LANPEGSRRFAPTDLPADLRSARRVLCELGHDVLRPEVKQGGHVIAQPLLAGLGSEFRLVRAKAID
jgi:hypothetical protein